ncbi:MAG: polysaccharide lyase beta-sandwich domain-containing protein [Bacteroidia bacterium]|nr:polysaccharide lyase beta-sandwich domain-containing protein [Bacteroidia bacterium]
MVSRYATRCAVISGIMLFMALKPVIANPDLEIIRQKIINGLLAPDVNEQKVKSLMSSIRSDGSWPGINYEDLSRTGFQNGQHLYNLVELSRAYKKKGSAFRGNKRLRQTINSSLGYWLEKDFICDNWWWNQIGTPDQFVKILLIMDKDLSPEQVAKSLPIAGRANLNASGARPSGDRIKIAGILAKNSLFRRDAVLFDETIKVIAGEIKFSTGPGMQYDYGFHHRTDKVTSILSYGTGYADAFAEWAALVAGTKYSFPEEKLDQLIDYYLDGICQSMAYGKYPDPGASNRDISRAGHLEARGTATPERLMKATSYRKEELDKIVKIRKDEIKLDLSSTKFFWLSEYFTHQRPGYFVSVRMFSSRNHNMEMPYNSEGLMNHHYADGSNFISRTGEEYYDIFPVFDWQKIPGTTIVQKPSLPPESEIQKKGLTEFVGAVTDGHTGAAVFDFSGPHDPLTAKKSWFFFEDEYVCLGAGINSAADLPVVTTLNQCLLKGDVVAMIGNERSVIDSGDHKLKNVKWVLHDKIAYIFPEPVSVSLSNQSATGSWYRINKQSDSPKKEITLDVFKLWLNHGNRPSNGEYSYIVVPVADEKKMIENSADRNIEIISNNTNIQAVRNTGLGQTQMVFYRAGEIIAAQDIRIGIESPGLVMVKTDGKDIRSISVADPSGRLRKIHITVNARIEKKGENFKAIWDDSKQVSEIAVDLPLDVYAGKSVSIDL